MEEKKRKRKEGRKIAQKILRIFIPEGREENRRFSSPLFSSLLFFSLLFSSLLYIKLYKGKRLDLREEKILIRVLNLKTNEENNNRRDEKFTIAKKFKIKFKKKLKYKKIELICLIIIKYIIFSFLIINITTKTNNNYYNSHDSSIIIKINQAGDSYIYNSEFFKPPDEFIHYITYVNAGNKINLNSDNNTIKLIWKDNLKNCIGMFSGCSNISEIDLSNFDFSEVEYVNRMFENCFSLTSINFGNIDTSKILVFDAMFSGCTSLKKLDLSLFNTSRAYGIARMFYGCSNLVELDIHSFDTSHVDWFYGMFEGCSSLVKDISNFDTSSAVHLDSMFKDCKSLKYLNLSNFDTKNVKEMHEMFEGCESLVELDITRFNTSSVENMCLMFYGCKNLVSLDITNFNTAKVTGMQSMFRDCSSLTELDLSTFDTSEVNSMEWMFGGCTSLISLNINNLNTTKVTYIHCMFFGCSSLVELNLSNFDTNNAGMMEYFFSDCVNLEYINIEKFSETNLHTTPNQWYPNGWYNIFHNVPDDLVICLNENNINILNELNQSVCYHIDCEHNWRLKRSSEIIEYIDHVKTCINTYGITKEESFQNCVNFYKNDILCKCKNEQCLFCPTVDKYKGLCYICNFGYYPKNNDTLNKGDYINCYKDPIGFYLDIEEYNYKKCYKTCEKCDAKGDENNHNCITCDPYYPIKIKFDKSNNYSNCYEKCEYNYYIDNYNNYICTGDDSCPDEFSKHIPAKNKCVKNCDDDDIYIYEYQNICTDEIRESEYCDKDRPYEHTKLLKCVNETECSFSDLLNKICILKYKEDSNTVNTKKENDENIIQDKEKLKQEEIKLNDNLLNKAEEGFTSENYDTSNLDNGTDAIIETEKMKIVFTTSKNQKNNTNNNMTTLDLGECEVLLREFYNISEEEQIYMKKIEVKQEGVNIPKIEFDVYSKLNGENLIKLNKSICSQTKVSIFTPTSQDIDINKLNSSSDYYNDPCYVPSSDDGLDISLSDRKNEFSDYAVCQDDCELSEYDKSLHKAKCDCKVTETSLSFGDMTIDKEKLFSNFKDFKNIANVNLLVCYQTLFSKKGLIHNIGFYIVVPILIFHLICIIIFYCYSKNKLEEKINKIIKIKKELEHKIKIKKTNSNKLFNHKSKSIAIEQNKNNNIKKLLKINNKQKRKSNKNNQIRFKKGMAFNNKNNNKNNNYFNNLDNSLNKQNKKNKQTKTIKKLINIEYNPDELNELDYRKAIKYDKRNYCQYYISLLKIKHPILFSFFYNEDYNSKIIKINLFFVSFTIYYTVNALFYNDDTMHVIYESKGSFNLEYKLPKLIYSFLISTVLNKSLSILALSNRNIVELKQNKNIKESQNESFDIKRLKVIKKISIKFILYFIISFLFLVFFWYYLSMFCAIFRNTQYHLIKDTLISFGLSLLYPFEINLAPGWFRIPALSAPNKKKEYVYKFSKFIQVF